MEVLRTAILDQLRQNKGGEFSTALVVQQMYPQDWEHFLEEINAVAISMSKEGLLAIDQVGNSYDDDTYLAKPLVISAPKKNVISSEFVNQPQI